MGMGDGGGEGKRGEEGGGKRGEEVFFPPSLTLSQSEKKEKGCVPVWREYGVRAGYNIRLL